MGLQLEKEEPGGAVRDIPKDLSPQSGGGRARLRRGLPRCKAGGGEGMLTSSWGSTTGTHLKIRREVSPTVTQRFSLMDEAD